MTYLLDTVAVLKALDNTLPPKTSRRLQKSGTRLLVSIVTPWEIALKKFLHFQGISHDRVQQAVLDLGASILPVTMQHIGRLYTMPQYPTHSDPFDRMMIAQALDEGCPIVTSDARFELYERVGLKVWWN